MAFWGLRGLERIRAERRFFNELAELRAENRDMPADEFKKFAVDTFRDRYEEFGIDIDKLEQLLELIVKFLPLIIAMFAAKDAVRQIAPLLLAMLCLLPAQAIANEPAAPSMFAAAESLEPCPSMFAAAEGITSETEYVTTGVVPEVYESMNLTEPLDEFDEPAAVDLEPAGQWVTETYWATDCSSGTCTPIQMTRQVWRPAGVTASPASAEPYVAGYSVPIVSGVFGRLRARRFALRERWANRPRLFGRCRGCR